MEVKSDEGDAVLDDFSKNDDDPYEKVGAVGERILNALIRVIFDEKYDHIYAKNDITVQPTRRPRSQLLAIPPQVCCFWSNFLYPLAVKLFVIS